MRDQIQPKQMFVQKAATNKVQVPNHKTIQSKAGTKPPIQAKQRPVQRQGKYAPLASKQTPIQRKSKANQIAQQMGEQHGVDTSNLEFHHNSSFPTSVGAEATIQGNKIDFAPGKDSMQNIKHEVGHAIDNAKNGTPQGNKMVNGHKVDTTREAAADQMMNTPLQQKTNTDTELISPEPNQIVQRVVVHYWDGNDYDTGNEQDLDELADRLYFTQGGLVWEMTQKLLDTLISSL